MKNLVFNTNAGIPEDRVRKLTVFRRAADHQWPAAPARNSPGGVPSTASERRVAGHDGTAAQYTSGDRFAGFGPHLLQKPVSTGCARADAAVAGSATAVSGIHRPHRTSVVESADW